MPLLGCTCLGHTLDLLPFHCWLFSSIWWLPVQTTINQPVKKKKHGFWLCVIKTSHYRCQKTECGIVQCFVCEDASWLLRRLLLLSMFHSCFSNVSQAIYVAYRSAATYRWNVFSIVFMGPLCSLGFPVWYTLRHFCATSFSSTNCSVMFEQDQAPWWGIRIVENIFLAVVFYMINKAYVCLTCLALGGLLTVLGIGRLAVRPFKFFCRNAPQFASGITDLQPRQGGGKKTKLYASVFMVWCFFGLFSTVSTVTASE